MELMTGKPFIDQKGSYVLGNSPLASLLNTINSSNLEGSSHRTVLSLLYFWAFSGLL